jgi:hypothetical protein
MERLLGTHELTAHQIEPQMSHHPICLAQVESSSSKAGQASFGTCLQCSKAANIIFGIKRKSLLEAGRSQQDSSLTMILGGTLKNCMPITISKVEVSRMRLTSVLLFAFMFLY